MDGLWSSPDLPALLRLAAAEPRGAGAVRRLVPACRPSSRRTVAHRLRRNTQGRQPAQHRRPLRPRQRLLPAVPRRDDDLLERGLRRARTSRWPTPSGTSTGASRPSAGLRAGQHVLEIGTGWGGFALYAAGELGLPRDDDHDLAGAARPRPRRASAAAGLDAPRRRPAARLPRHHGHVRRHRLDRDARGRRRRVLRDLLRGVRPGAAPGRPAEPPGRSPSRMPPTSGSCRGANWIQTYIFPGGLCPSLAVIERSTRDTRLLDPAASTTSPPTTSGRCGRGGRRSSARLDEVRALGFDERFIRMWDYYLALSEAGFATGISQDLQISWRSARAAARSHA